MILIPIGLSILTIFIIYLTVCYIFSGKIHKNIFSHRQELDKRITFYSNEEFGVDKEKYTIDTPEGKIVGHFYHNSNYDKTKLVIFCHGMGSSKEAYIQEASYIASKGYLVYLFDYIGTNESEGNQLHGFANSIYSLDLVISHLKNDDAYKNLDLYVMGHSWGGYASSGIVKLHPDIKGTICLSPLVSVFRVIHYAKKGKPFFMSLMFDLYDKLAFEKKYRINVLKALDEYKGKVIMVQSKDDPVVTFKASLGYIQKYSKNKNIEYVILDNKQHSPDYTDEAVKKWNEFNEAYRTTKDLDKLFSETDFHACGELDTEFWNNMLDKLFN